MAVAQGGVGAAVEGVVKVVFAEVGEDVFGLAEFDELAGAGALAMAQGGEDGESALGAGSGVGHQDGGVVGRVGVGVAAERSVSDHAFDVDAVGAEVAVGAAVAVGGHPQHNDVVFDGPEGRVGYAEFVHSFGGVVFDEYVADGDEAVEDFPSAGVKQVDGHTEFVAGVGVEHRGAVEGAFSGHAAGDAAGVEGEVVDDFLGGMGRGAAGEGDEGFGGFDADDFGAEVGEEGAAVGAGPDDGDFEDAESLQGQGRHMYLAIPGASCRRRMADAIAEIAGGFGIRATVGAGFRVRPG